MSDNLINSVALNASYSTPSALCVRIILLCESLTKCRSSIHAGPQNRGHHVWLLTFLKRLNKFVRFWHSSKAFHSEHIWRLYFHQMLTLWRHLAKVSTPDFDFDDCCGNFSARRWTVGYESGEVFWIKSVAGSSFQKDGTIEAVHGLLEQQKTVLVGDQCW